MTCKEISDFLAGYLEGSLPLRQRIVFRLHLAICSDCRRYLASYKKTVRLVGSLKDDPSSSSHEQVPEDLVNAILAARCRETVPEKKQA